MKIHGSDHEKVSLSEIRRRLLELQGPEQWRSLEQLAGSAAFQDLLKHEFAAGTDTWTDPVGRRRFLQLMGASLALAGVVSCTKQPEERIVPYVRQPEQFVPGRPLFFATSMPLDGYGVGLLAESHDGRPTKLEGNPDHPASLGGTSALAQASVLGLYDPDRVQVIKNMGRIRTWNTFTAALTTQVEHHRVSAGQGLRILTGTVTSPTLAAQLDELLALLPGTQWHQYQPVSRDSVREGGRLAFGDYVNVYYRLDRADVILSLDADFLMAGPGAVRYARDFAARRQVENSATPMNRLYMVESYPTLSGTMADHRMSLRASEITSLAASIASRLGLTAAAETAPDPHANWLDAVIRDLEAHRGSSLVLAGDEQPPEVHALVYAVNQALGNLGRTVIVTDPAEASPTNQLESLTTLVRDLQAGSVESLLILGGNPVFDAPADLDFEGALQRAAFRACLGPDDNETSNLCHWQIPESHYLESWGDVRGYDGTASIIQPLITPLYDSRTATQMLAVLLGRPGLSDYELVREHWQRVLSSADFEKTWRKALHDGYLDGSTPAPRERSAAAPPAPKPVANPGGLELNFRPDPTVYDGRFANNAWLQELPKPLTKLTWDNAAILSPATAEKEQLSNGDVVELVFDGRAVQAPVWILPGHPADSVTVHFGYGRARVGRVGAGSGFNAYALRSSRAMNFGPGLELRKTGTTQLLVSTQDHSSMEGRHLVRHGTAEEYRRDPHLFQQQGHEPSRELSLYPPVDYTGYAWGMAIDLHACTGCNACVVACQAENNIPVVGKQEVANGREMHWLRLDRYFEGDLDAPQTYHQPVPCMHCENAPCEPVCPVAATVHSQEGLNDMVYNRCVGTRYCSNNCPYKVRRFNFLLYADFDTPSLKLQRNPDVSVRSRGVMEKCTYCVQRISEARIGAKREDREIRDGEIQTACQAACPSQAIVFGNINDPASQVARWKASPRNYLLLAELNTRPRTSYLAQLQNPNPELEGG